MTAAGSSEASVYSARLHGVSSGLNQYSCLFLFLGAQAKLRKAAISFFTSVRLSVRTVQLCSYRKDFHEILYLRIFRKSRENSSFIKIWQEQPVLYMKTDVHLWLYLPEFFSEWEMFQTKVVENIKSYILCSIAFLQKSCLLWDNVEKRCTAGQATDDNMAHAHCMLDT